MATAKEVSLFIISLADLNDPDGVSNLKLQKLLYYMQGFHLAAFDNSLFRDSIEAWEHGPVVPPVWREYTRFGANPIRLERIEGVPLFSERQHGFLEDVFQRYGYYSGSGLRNITHQEPPWIDAWEHGQNTIITHKSMREYFKTKLV